MSTVILLEWSVSMFEPVINWDLSSSVQLERISQLSVARNLSVGVSGLYLGVPPTRSINLPTRLDIAATAIKAIAGKAAHSLNAEFASVHAEAITFATFDSTVSNVSTNYSEFHASIVSAINANPPGKVSYVAMLQWLKSKLSNVRGPVNIILFGSSAKNLTATQEFINLDPDFVAELLPLPVDSSIFFVTIARGTFDSSPAADFYRPLLDLCKCYGEILECSESAVENLATSLYQPFFASLKFGAICGKVQLIPRYSAS